MAHDATGKTLADLRDQTRGVVREVGTTFVMSGYAIDLERLYRAMYDQSVVEDGVRLFHGNSRYVRAVKRLLHDLFDVPVRDNVHPTNNRIRKESEVRMAALGWATKTRGRSARYELHREL